MERGFLYRIESEFGDGANSNGDEKDWNIVEFKRSEVGEVVVPQLIIGI